MATSYWVRTIADLFEGANIGALFVRQGTIRSSNLLARTILGHGDGLYDNKGRLTAQRPADDRSLQRLIGAVLSPNRRVVLDGPLVVRRPARLPLVVQLHPVTLPGGADRGHPFRAALVLIRDPEFMAPIDHRHVAEVLDLSSIESRVAALLFHGRSVREIADAIHRSEHTVRWTLKNVYAKTRCAGQVDLVRLIGRLAGDILPPGTGETPGATQGAAGARLAGTGKSSPRE